LYLIAFSLGVLSFSGLIWFGLVWFVCGVAGFNFIVWKNESFYNISPQTFF